MHGAHKFTRDYFMNWMITATIPAITNMMPPNLVLSINMDEGSVSELFFQPCVILKNTFGSNIIRNPNIRNTTPKSRYTAHTRLSIYKLECASVVRHKQIGNLHLFFGCQVLPIRSVHIVLIQYS